MKDTYSLVILPGDGIGIEVVREAMKVLDAVQEIAGVRFETEEIDCGGHYYADHGVEWPEGSFEKCEAADAILLGAVGHEVNGEPVSKER
jgi:isocitrate/isopropylmalate dehydrogenase